jgi:hypothetical protein
MIQLDSLLKAMFLQFEEKRKVQLVNNFSFGFSRNRAAEGNLVLGLLQRV